MQFLFKFHKTPLLLAIEKGNKEIVEVLLQHRNIDVNAKIYKAEERYGIQKY